MDLFVCWANVQRSQMAQAFAKKMWIDAISCASIEDKREKYLNKPEKTVTKLMKENFDLDISNQEVSYPNEILDKLDQIENIYFLYDPKEARIPDEKLLVDWKSFWKYLDFVWKKYEIHKIKDPDEDVNTADSMLEIVYDIEKLINKLYWK